jgi:hypothetical protein
MKIKRTVFQIDSSKKEEVKQWLNSQGIIWSSEARFRFDYRTAVVVVIVLLTLEAIVIPLL